jgi:methionine-rich copper-binding protein CopC
VQGLSIKHVQFAQQIQVANPVKNNFEIHFSANLLNQIINLKIYNQSGHLVESQKIATVNSDFQITPTASLPEGIYLLRFENKEGLSVIKKIAKY